MGFNSGLKGLNTEISYNLCSVKHGKALLENSDFLCFLFSLQLNLRIIRERMRASENTSFLLNKTFSIIKLIHYTLKSSRYGTRRRSH